MAELRDTVWAAIEAFPTDSLLGRRAVLELETIWGGGTAGPVPMSEVLSDYPCLSAISRTMLVNRAQNRMSISRFTSPIEAKTIREWARHVRLCGIQSEEWIQLTARMLKDIGIACDRITCDLRNWNLLGASNWCGTEPGGTRCCEGHILRESITSSFNSLNSLQLQFNSEFVIWLEELNETCGPWGNVSLGANTAGSRSDGVLYPGLVGYGTDAKRFRMWVADVTSGLMDRKVHRISDVAAAAGLFVRERGSYPWPIYEAVKFGASEVYGVDVP